MRQIQRIAHARFISVHKNLAFLLQIRDQFTEYSLELQTVDDNINAVGLDYVPQRFLGILEQKLVLFFLFKLRAAERAAYHDTGTSVRFPLTAAAFTLHLFSPPFRT